VRHPFSRLIADLKVSSLNFLPQRDNTVAYTLTSRGVKFGVSYLVVVVVVSPHPPSFPLVRDFFPL